MDAGVGSLSSAGRGVGLGYASAMRRNLPDIGLLVMRVGLGAMFVVVHGWPKVAGGAERWEKLGGAMGAFGIDFAPVFWGACASFAEFLGGLLLVVGLFTRQAAAVMLTTMIVAAAMHLDKGDGLKGASHAIEVGFALIGLIGVGAGKYSLDARRGAA